MVGRKSRSRAVCDSAHSAIRDVCCFLDDGSAVNMAAGRSEMSKDPAPAPACISLAQRFELGVIISRGGVWCGGVVPMHCAVQRHARWSQLVSSRCPTATWTTASGRVDPVCRCRTTGSLAGNQATAGFGRKIVRMFSFVIGDRRKLLKEKDKIELTKLTNVMLERESTGTSCFVKEIK